MNRATRIVVGVIGGYAGLLGMAHGVFEYRQGRLPTGGILIDAIAPCQREVMWHACFPAMTVLPNFFLSGILAIIAGLFVLFWAVGFAHRKRGGAISIGLSALLLLVGGGFTPPALGVLSGAIATRIDRPSQQVGTLSGPFGAFLAKLWPWPVFGYIGWLITQTLVGIFFGAFMLKLGVFALLITNLLLLTMILSGFAADRHSRDVN
jgi:hypothetical protein